MTRSQQSQTKPQFYRAPPEVRGMTTLDREAFTQTVTVPALRIPKGATNKVAKCLKRCRIPLPGVRGVVKEESAETDDFHLLLLDPDMVSSASSFTEAEAELLRSLDVPRELLYHALPLTYDNLKSEEVLRAVLPEGRDVSTAFSRVGHIAHMNLRDHQLPYRKLIGQVIMDKNPGVTCVVNKTEAIDLRFRNFRMEVLAGEKKTTAKVKENGLTYKFDFSCVYWNPRLGTEHGRVVSLIKRGDAVLDVFAGVGPFALPAARRGATTVLANDLNKDSYHWLQHNSKLNKVDGLVRTFNLDGRAFIRGPVRRELPALLKGTASVHIVMNLPTSALEFLDAFRGLLSSPELSNNNLPIVELSNNNLPIVHCYGFSKHDDPKKDVVERASSSLGFPLVDRCSVHLVRNVSPNKEMMCVSFTLPKEVLYSRDGEQTNLTAEPTAPKRRKCEETIN